MDVGTSKVKTLLVHVGAPLAVGTISAFLAPTPGSDNLTALDLAVFFSTMAVIMATLLVALALLSAFPARIGHSIRKALSPATFLWFAVGEAGGVLGMIPTWAFEPYRYFFAATLAGAATAVVTVVYIGIVNLSAQQREDEAYMARHLDPSH
jgi:hypothetical protein